MQLRFAPEPENGPTLVRAGLSRILRRPKGLPQVLSATKLADVQVKQAHPVYDLHADEIANGRGLDSAHPTGFRYLVYASNASVAAAEVQMDSAGKATLLSNVNFGPFVEGTARALGQLAGVGELEAISKRPFGRLKLLILRVLKRALKPALGSESYEVRLLRFSAIGVMALWLRSDATGRDIVYPLAPTPDILQAGKRYSPAGFLAAIRPLAKTRAGREGPLIP